MKTKIGMYDISLIAGATFELGVTCEGANFCFPDLSRRELKELAQRLTCEDEHASLLIHGDAVGIDLIKDRVIFGAVYASFEIRMTPTERRLLRQWIKEQLK